MYCIYSVHREIIQHINHLRKQELYFSTSKSLFISFRFAINQLYRFLPFRFSKPPPLAQPKIQMFLSFVGVSLIKQSIKCRRKKNLSHGLQTHKVITARFFARGSGEKNESILIW